jgi:alkylated DNA repair dioxygenase AlkB
MLLEEIVASGAGFEQGVINAAGDRVIAAPRLCLSYGDRPYAFPDMGGALPWPQQTSRVRDELARLAGHPFNYALVNWYRDGRDFAGWHADKMHLHEPDTEVAILSLGTPRPLLLRDVDGLEQVGEVELAPGSLLRMRGTLHTYYEHCVPVVPNLAESRYSITFRQLNESVVQA